MGRFLSPEILGFIRRAQEVDHLGVRDAEALILGVHHAELGGLIAQHWKLPPRIVKGITYHHDPSDGDDVVCDYVYAANLLAKHIEAGLANRALELEPDPATADRLGLTTTPLSTLVPPALDRYAEVSLRFNAV